MSHIQAIRKDKSDQAERAKTARTIKAGLNNDYKTVFSTPEGVRVLNDILAMCHVFQTSFSYTGEDQIKFREGERNIGLKILKKMNIVDQNALFRAFSINLKQEYKK